MVITFPSDTNKNIKLERRLTWEEVGSNPLTPPINHREELISLRPVLQTMPVGYPVFCECVRTLLMGPNFNVLRLLSQQKFRGEKDG
jgi:hypothetical protein